MNCDFPSSADHRATRYSVRDGQETFTFHLGASLESPRSTSPAGNRGDCPTAATRPEPTFGRTPASISNSYVTCRSAEFRVERQRLCCTSVSTPAPLPPVTVTEVPTVCACGAHRSPKANTGGTAGAGLSRSCAAQRNLGYPSRQGQSLCKAHYGELLCSTSRRVEPN